MLRHQLTESVVLLTGGGSGGHLYPLLAVADAIQTESHGAVALSYAGPAGSYAKALSDHHIKVHEILAGKLRRYLSLQNLIDIPKLFIGFIQALAIMYSIMPDVVFSKGGPGAFPVVLAARFYRIPVIIHESDALPGLTNRLSAPFAARIAVGFPSTATYFPRKKVAYVGTPLRPELARREAYEDRTYAKRELGFDEAQPLMLVTGGSQGSTRINQFVFDTLADLLPRTQIYHQVGVANENGAREAAGEALERVPKELRSRYKLTPLLDAELMRRALTAADLMLCRAGASTIYEAAAFGCPTMLVPLPEAANGHQRVNAFEYAKTGAATVIEENNFTPHLVLRELERILGDANAREAMGAAARAFYRPQAAEIIAREALRLAGFNG